MFATDEPIRVWQSMQGLSAFVTWACEFILLTAGGGVNQTTSYLAAAGRESQFGQSTTPSRLNVARKYGRTRIKARNSSAHSAPNEC